jgi:hypothetical protein
LRESKDWYEQLEARYDSLDNTNHLRMLMVLATSLSLSVGVPLGFHAAHVLGPILENNNTMAFTEQVFVISSWTIGLIFVLGYIFSIISSEEEELEEIENVEIKTFTEELPNIVEIPEEISPSEEDQYVRDQMKSGETVRFVNERLNNTEHID